VWCPFQAGFLRRPADRVGVAVQALLTPVFPYEFDPVARKRARSYERGSRRISILGGTLLPLAFALAFWASGASRAMADFASSLAGGRLLLADTLYIVLFALLFAALTLPVGFYSGHLREKRWGMTHRRVSQFAKDAAKSIALGTLFALAILLPFFYVVRHVDAWWLVAAGLFSLYLLFSTSVLPNLLLPIFYKVEPLPDGALRSSILAVASQSGVPPIASVVVMKESAKSPRANAFVHGIGRTRRVVLFDTLLREFHPREVRFTVAHEVGHLAHRDVGKFFLLTLALVFPELWFLSLALGQAGSWFGVRGVFDVAILPLLLVTVSLIGLLDRVAFSWVSRRAEAAADAFALEATQDPAAAESMMKRLCDLNLLDEQPHPLLERLLYSHPAPARRIDTARAFALSHSALSHAETPSSAP
jgi:STE24 endopeptidase